MGSRVTGTDYLNSNVELWDVDGNDHGTHCAGTIAAIGNNGKGVVGVNPNAHTSDGISLHIAKGLKDSGGGNSDSVLSAVASCVDNGANIISMSLGGGGYSSNENSVYRQTYQDENILIIAAAGNDGNSAKSYPASYDSVMSVAAVDANNDIAWFSQYNSQVEISGPGVDVESTIPGEFLLVLECVKQKIGRD